LTFRLLFERAHFSGTFGSLFVFSPGIILPPFVLQQSSQRGSLPHPFGHFPRLSLRGRSVFFEKFSFPGFLISTFVFENRPGGPPPLCHSHGYCKLFCDEGMVTGVEDTGILLCVMFWYHPPIHGTLVTSSLPAHWFVYLLLTNSTSQAFKRVPTPFFFLVFPGL